MKVCLYTNLFYPDQIAGASLYTDMVRFFRDRGDDVRIVGTFGYYPAWKLVDADKGCWLRYEDFEGIPLKRVKMWVPKKPTGITRMLSDFSFLFSLIFLGRFKDWKPDVVLTAEPMLSQCLAQRFIYPFSNIPGLIIVQDFVVDAALELGMLKLPVLSHFLKWMERWALRSARTLTSISEPMVEKLIGIIGEDRRIEYIPNWVHGSLEDEIYYSDGKNERRSALLFYSGNVGMKQGLPQFLEDFEAANLTDWSIDIHGGGANIENLRKSAEGKDWITLGELLDEPEYVEKLLSVSACLITQQPGVTANFLPSKLLPALAAGTPVLAICDEDSPLAIEVNRGNCGVVLNPGDIESLRQTLKRWKASPIELQTLGQNAKKHAENFSRETILTRYEEELSMLVDRRGKSKCNR